MPRTTLIEEYPERDALEAVRADLAVLVPATVAANFKVKRGDVCGVITASSKLRRRSRTTANSTGFAVDSPVGHVTDASVFVAGDVLKNAAGATIGTIAAGGVDPVANTVTLTGNAAVAVAAGAAVLGSDGSQVASCISYNETDSGAVDTNVSVYVAGPLKEAKLRGLDATAKAELMGRSFGGIFLF